jgi:hypothetical protein
MPLTGQPGPVDPPESPRLPSTVAAPVVERAPPARPLWIDDHMIVFTRRVWSKRLGRPVPEDEAVEILVNVQRFGEALFRLGPQEGSGDERRDLGAGVVERTEGRLLH